jgi:hypothetical protein
MVMSVTPLQFGRAAVMQVLQAAKEHQLDHIPKGLNNSIRWNAGHVLVIMDRVLVRSPQYTPVIPEEYKAFFDMNTRPAEWTGHPPAVADLIRLSGQQMVAAQRLLSSDQQESFLSEPFKLRDTEFKTLADVLGFLCFHEGMHFNTMKLCYRLTKSGTDRWKH